MDINVNFDDLKFCKIITSGGFSDVYKAYWQAKNRRIEVAVKIIKPLVKADDILREILKLKQFNHQNIVTFFGTARKLDNKIVLIFEHADCGSLYDFLHHKNMQVSYVGKLSWMLQCAKGIDYLHSKNTIHRNLKTQNLLLFNKHRVLKICNFGTVKKFAMKNTEGTGTFSYMAPEVYDDSEKYSEKSDVFSFGIIVWEVMSRLKPFYELNSAFHTTIQMEINKGVRPNVKDMRSYNNFEHIIFIIKQCWSQDPDQRPTIKELIFFLGFDPRSFRYNPDLLLTGRPLRDICDEDFRV